MKKSIEDKDRLEKMVLEYLAERQDLGIAIQHLANRIKRLWPQCQTKVNRASLEDLAAAGRLELVVEGRLLKVYGKGFAPPVAEAPAAISEVAESVSGATEIAVEEVPAATESPLPAAEASLEPTKTLPEKVEKPDNPEMAARIAAVCDELKRFLLAKNQAYGNSAADPIRIFSRSNPIEQINIRIDDKLSRLMHGSEFPGDDTELDLIGYLILKRVLVMDPKGWNLEGCGRKTSDG